MRIEKITKNHLEDFVNLWNQAYKVLTSSQFKMTLKRAKYGFRNKMFDYIGIFKEDKLLGFLLLHRRADTLWLKHLLIDKNFRRKSLGKKLLRKAIEISKKKKKKLKTEVIKENISGRSFFTKNSFKIIKFDKKENQYILKYS